jgi:hypothetical protein
MACPVQSAGAYRRVVATVLSDSLRLCRGRTEARRTFGERPRIFPTFDACQPGQRKCFLHAKSDGAGGHLAKRTLPELVEIVVRLFAPVSGQLVGPGNGN